MLMYFILSLCYLQAIIAKGEKFAHSDPPQEKWLKKLMKDPLTNLNIPLLEIPLLK